MKRVFFILLGLAVLAVAGLVWKCQHTGIVLNPLVNDILTDLDAEKYAEVYERAAEPFKAGTTLEQFQADTEARKQALGAYKGLSAVKGFQSWKGTKDGDIDGVTVEVQFEKATVDGTFTFVRVDGGHQWKAIDIPIPEDAASESPDPAPEPK